MKMMSSQDVVRPLLKKRTALVVKLCSVIAVVCGITSAQARITWDFEDGTMQGWTNKMTSPDVGLSFTNTVEFATWSGDPDYGNAALGAYFLAQTYIYSEAHQSLWVQSPPFKLDGSGDLTFRGMGAGGADIPVTTIPAESSGEGTCAVCLRRDDGTFVLTRHVGGDTSTFDVYSFTAAELAPFANDGHWYTVDVVDFYSGTYPSFIAVDNVSVPGKMAGYIDFDFNDGTMQGWTNTMVSTYEVIDGTTYGELSFGAVTQVGGGGRVQNGNFLGESLPDYTGHHKTICVESPHFTLNGLGGLTFKVDGCRGGDETATYTLVNPLPPVTLPGWFTNSVTAIGLRRDDGTFVLTQVPQDYNNGFITYSWTAAQLQGFVNDGHTYTLAMVDTLAGGPSWIALDEVSIPGTLIRNSQTITGFGSLTNRPAGAYNLSTEFPSAAGNPSGLPVTFEVVSGPAVMSGSILTVTNMGIVFVKAIQSGDYMWYPATPITNSFTVLAIKAPQVINFSALDNQAYLSGFVLNATASSFLPVSYTLSGPATLDGNTVTCTNLGEVIVTAYQPGSVVFHAAVPVSQSFQVTNTTQTITFPAVYDQNITNVVALDATASSGLQVSYTVSGPANLSGTNLTFTGVGPVTITASQAGSAKFLAAAPVSWTFNVKNVLWYTFSDGTMQGWTNIMASYATSGYYDLAFAVQTIAGSENTDLPRWSTTPEVAAAHSVPAEVGKYLLSEAPRANDTVGWHVYNDDTYTGPVWPAPGSGAHQTLWVQSPPFHLNGTGDLTYWGTGSEFQGPATNQISLTNWVIPQIAGTWGADNGHPVDTDGICAVGLRRDDGIFVLSQGFLHWGSSWDLYRFTAEELAPFVNDGHTYTLNMIDALCGSSAWCAIANITIPGGTEVPQPTRPTVRVKLNAAKSGVILTWDSSVAGLSCTVLSSSVITAPVSSWSTASTVTTVAGETSVELPLTGGVTFYRIKY